MKLSKTYNELIDLRKLIIEAAYHAGHGHIPSALSIVEILVAIDRIKTEDDIFVLSKGHGCLAYYAYLVQKNIITRDELRNFGKKGSKLGGHPDRNKIKEVYASTGSLGHGFPISVGSALARKIQNIPGRVICLIGDGESNEGTIWESCMVASKNKLSNLVCIVDNNNSQIRSLPAENLSKKFLSFGWEVWDIDGHDIKMISRAITDCNSNEKPIAVIANTIKGKGISDIENDMFAWHHRAPNDGEYKKFIKEIDES
ncbi:transketolase [archaeon]|nr:transketolase [archaeon]